MVDEAQFRIIKKGIFIELMDPSRICLIRITLSDTSYKMFCEGSNVLNLETLKKSLYCNADDKSLTTLLPLNKMLLGFQDQFIFEHKSAEINKNLV